MSEVAAHLDALRRLRAAIGGDREGLSELVADYLEAAPQLVARLRDASRSNDTAAMRLAAHELKSNSRDFGAMELGCLAEELESLCRSGEADDHVRRIERIAVEEAASRKVLSCVDLSDV